MPAPIARAFCRHRARRILRLLGMDARGLAQLANRRLGRHYGDTHMSSFLGKNGLRPLPDPLVMLLKSLVREKQIERGRHRPFPVMTGGHKSAA